MAVVRLYFEEDVLRPVPLVKHLFHGVILITQSETYRSLVPLVAGVTGYFNLHLGIRQKGGPATADGGH